MEPIVFALAAIVLAVTLLFAVAVVRRSLAGRQVEQRFRTDGDLEPISRGRRSRVPAPRPRLAIRRAA